MSLRVDRPFTRQQANDAGITDAMLRRRSAFRRLLRGVYLAEGVPVTLHLWLLAALLAAPPGSVVSHLTALRWYGYEQGPLLPLHVSTRGPTHSRLDELEVHRRGARITEYLHHGVPVTGPDRTIVDLARDVSIPRLIEIIEWMMGNGFTTVDRLADYALNRHLHGVRRVRSVLGRVRAGAESPTESRVRLMLVFARLPEPELNVNLCDDDGHWLARGDLCFLTWKVLVEYDGWQHERDAQQRVNDIARRERLEAAGWRLIVITAGDLGRPRQIVHRVHNALTDRGYAGPRPVMSSQWDTWFPTRN
ncbi:hypothetical protein [Aeromicrobium wangtongii]|uniref:hypothetical protein n=1 Tax=Aeromicrobium wangtongii TaxID=2969247 RepID=UPI00201786F7|nr:hypothetical protein [Aeromicrobium wangtongii]MCL3817220.1 hypothetical protein [Aeromicrobium wangtongii]